MTRYNVVYLHTHDTGRRISPYGFAVHTPNLARLADDGVIFRNAFCAAPTCSPSRAAMLSGRWAHCTGMIGLHHRGFRLTHPRHHLAAYLKSQQYHTALVGVNHVHAEPAEIGYERVLEHASPHARDVAPAAAAFLREQSRTDQDESSRPFFLDVGLVETHRGRFVDADGLHPNDRPDRMQPPANLPDLPATRFDAARFATAARHADEGFGHVLAALDETGLSASTVVVCTTDHGVGFPHHKCNVTDAGMGVMLLMRGPQRWLRGGRTVDALVSQVDVFPTLCDLLGLPKPAWLQGTSLLPVLDGSTDEVRGELFGEVTYHAGYEPQRAVRTTRFKYVRRWDNRTDRPLPHRRHPIASNIDDGPSKDVVVDAGWLDRALPEEALYDLHLDPHERENVVADPAHVGVVDDLRQRLTRWMRETADLLCEGQVALPAGAAVNRPDDLSPKVPLDPPSKA